MNYIVFDLEWNQSAEGKECSVEHMPFEIIEIGAVKLNSQMKQVSEFHRLVQPKAYKEMHFKISEVTHMDMEELCKKGLGIDGSDRASEEYDLSWHGNTVSKALIVLRCTETVFSGVF